MAKDDKKTRFPASKRTPGQAESRSSYQQFVDDRPEGLAWWDDYLELRAEGWDWRKAVFIAWASSPMRDRWPPTQEQLATDVLGLRTDRTIRKWRGKFPEIEERIVKLQAEPLMRYRRDAFQALVAVAITPEPSGHQDRKLFFEMTGDYRPRGTVALTGEDGGPIMIEGLDNALEQIYGDDGEGDEGTD